MKLLIKNIKGLVQAREEKSVLLKGADMKTLPILEDAWLAVEDGKIADFGHMSSWPGISDWRDLEVLDADGRFVFPSWVDSHTHIVYAGNRESEFVDRINGLSYEDIAARGGGILNSAAKLATTSEEELFEQAWTRLDEVMMLGTGAVEIKSGYGLTPETELKMLRVVKALSEKHPLTIKATFLGAHAFPAHFKNDKDAYVRQIIEEMIPRVAEEKLAEFIDVFCENNYFTNEQTARILDAGNKYGLIPKVHVNQFTTSGGIATSVQHGALSVDHLEVLNDADLEALKQGNTIPVALPGCSLFIRIPYTPARTIIDAGLPLALATDFNPGSCPSGNMNLVVSLACTQMNMTPEEAINAATVNAAYAMRLEHSFGSITPGHEANFFITKPMPSVGFLPYSFGSSMIDEVFVGGKKQ
jgi:imidazolonepropionase